MQAKNISQAKIFVPAIVIEFFIGKTIGGLKPGQAFLINQPSSWHDKAPPGSIEWSRLRAVVQQEPETDAEIAKQIADFTPIAGGFVGVIQAGGASHWNADFAIRAHPENMAGAVITFWARGEGDDQFFSYTHTRTELLSEAEDALSLKAQEQLTPRGAPRNVQRRTE